jgi:hypothetical protein
MIEINIVGGVGGWLWSCGCVCDPVKIILRFEYSWVVLEIQLQEFIAEPKCDKMMLGWSGKETDTACQAGKRR